jgi:hypothetical protein
LNHDIAQIEIAMSEDIGFTSRHTFPQILQGLLREMLCSCVVEGKAYSIPEFKVRVERSMGLAIREKQPRVIRASVNTLHRF